METKIDTDNNLSAHILALFCRRKLVLFILCNHVNISMWKKHLNIVSAHTCIRSNDVCFINGRYLMNGGNITVETQIWL